MIKINKKSSLPILFLFGFICSARAQQQFTFSQYMNNQTPVNAAYSTLDDAANINVTGRKQFAGIEGAPTSFLFNGSIPLAGLGSAAGLTVLNDKVGVEKLTELNAFFAKKIQLDKTVFLSTAINAGFRDYKNTYSALGSADPDFNNDDISQTSPNVGLALMLYSDRYYIGISAPRIALKKNQGVSNTGYLSAAYLFSLGNGDFSLKPAALISYAANNLPTTLDVSATLFMKDILGLGVNYRNNQAVSSILSLVINKNILLGYSYGFSVGSYSVGGFNNATQEFSIGYRFGKNISSPKML